MPKQAKETLEQRVESTKSDIIERLRFLVTDKEGNVNEAFKDSFQEFTVEGEDQILQSVAGMLVVNADSLAAGGIFYSPNISVAAESLTAEVIDLGNIAHSHGVTLIAVAGHYVTPEGLLLHGEEAYKQKRMAEAAHHLQMFKQMNKDAGPKLILPDQRIITK